MNNGNSQVRRKILVAEDDGVLSKGIEILLNNNGYSAKAAMKNESLSVLLRRQNFDLVLFGCGKPEEDLYLLGKIRKNCTMPPMIMINTLPEHKPEENGAAAFLGGTVEPISLLDKVQDVVRGILDTPVRCDCGNLLGIRKGRYLEIRCRRCKKTVRI